MGSQLIRSRGTLAELFSGRDNAVGLLRLLLALAVVVSHSRPLGFGQADPGEGFFGRQSNLGNLAVFGFFALSGLLITRSGRRTPIGRFLWHRALRIFPGLWVCLLVTALGVAPLVALREHGSLHGFWGSPDGPLSYLWANWWTGVRQWGIGDLLRQSTPWGRHTGQSVFNGALWSLAYEMVCYLVVAVFAVTGVLRRFRLLVLLLTGAAYFWIVRDYVTGSSRDGGVGFPLIGTMSYHWLIYLGFIFLLGAVFELYKEKIPVHDGLGIASGLVLAASLVFGGVGVEHVGLFGVLGLPAFAYLLVWLSIRLPRWTHPVGRKHDYSYGLYIYGFLGQQVLVSVGAARWGFGPFVALSATVALVAAVGSWHLVERHALRLKGWAPFGGVPEKKTSAPQRTDMVSQSRAGTS